MRNQLLGHAVALALMAPAEVVISGAGEQVEGTVISAQLQKQAKQALKAIWNIHEKLVSASKMVLELAQAAVKEADGEPKLALAKFDAACAGAVLDFRTEHKEDKGEDKEKLEDFLASDGPWLQYVSNIKGAIKDFPAEVFLTFPTESALRKARKAARQAKSTVKSLRGTMESKLDLNEVPDDKFAEAIKAATNESGTISEERLEKELRKLGAVEMEPETDDERDERIYNEAKQASVTFMGEDPRWQTTRESVCKLLVLLNQIPDDAGHESECNRILNNAYISIAKLYSLGHQSQGAQNQKETRGVANL